MKTPSMVYKKNKNKDKFSIKLSFKFSSFLCLCKNTITSFQSLQQREIKRTTEKVLEFSSQKCEIDLYLIFKNNCFYLLQ